MIKSLPLINRGRLSVQPVQSQAAFDLIVKLGETGGWPTEPTKAKKEKGAVGDKKGKGKAKKEEASEEEEVGGEEKVTKKVGGRKGGEKRKVEEKEVEGETEGRRKSARKG